MHRKTYSRQMINIYQKNIITLDNPYLMHNTTNMRTYLIFIAVLIIIIQTFTMCEKKIERQNYSPSNGKAQLQD